MAKYIKTLALTLTALVIVLPFLKWGGSLDWDLASVKPINLFPLLGLWAFGLMWAHYIMSAVKRHYPEAFNYKSWHRLTSNMVLVLILLHPSIIWFEAITNNFTLVDYVGRDNQIFISFGYFALAGFLMWEVVDRMRDSRFVIRNHRLLSSINNLAFIAVYFHGLSIGQHLQSGWLRSIWLIYGITTLVVLIHNYYYEFKTPADKN